MKTSIVAITCALCAAACAGSNNAPAQDATTTTMTPPAPYQGGSTEMMGTESDGTTTVPSTAAGTTLPFAGEYTSSFAPSRQGASQAEMDITAAIRRGIDANRSLSGRAGNVEVFTSGTIVTLRGTVGTEADRAAVEDLAWGTAGVNEVDDRLLVKR